MADKKISALTGATTPLAGTEVLPIVQSGSTVKVAVSDLTAGRAVSATGLTTGSATSLGLGTNGSISQMTLNTNGVVGLNVTPSTWLSTKTAIQMPDGSYYATTGGTLFVGANVYTNAASASTYVSNGYATRYRQTNGEHQFWTAVSGTAETTIPFTQVLNLDSSSNATLTSGNLIPGTAAKGINFTANTPVAGMTSQLLNWYEEGTWTPVVTPSAGALTAYTSNGTYARAGRIVTLRWTFTVTTAGTASGTAMISNAPFTCASGGNVLSCTGIVLETGATGVSYLCFIQPNVTNIKIQTLLTNTGIVWINSYVYEGSITYQAA